MDKELKDLIISSTITGRSKTTKCNISEIDKREGYPKGQMVMIVGSGRGASDLRARFQEHVKQMQKDMEKMKVTLIDLGEAGRAGASAGLALSEALKKMPLLCPEDMMIMDPNIDFSGLEKIVIDSFNGYDGPPFPSKFAGQYYDESGPITKKAYKKLKKMAGKAGVANDGPKPQNEIWANTWNHKIKRKLK